MTHNRGATGEYSSSPSVTDRRKNMKYKISTTSTTASGVVPIRGATHYPAEPSIYFTREAWVKQCHLVSKCNKEVGWFALVDHDETDNSFTITELVIPSQEVTAAETDIGKEDLADAAMELIEQGKDTSKMYAWFHSHVNMGVSPSPQDEYQVEDFLEDLIDQPEVPAFIRGIQNKAGDLKLDVYYIQHGVAYQNIDFYVIHDDDPQWLTDIEAEIKTKVTERYNTYYNRGSGGNRQQAGKNQDQSGGAAATGSNGFRRGYGDYDDWNDVYGIYGNDYWDSEDKKDDVPIIELEPADLNYADIADMEIMYQSGDMEVLLDKEGRLWVCDITGEVYDYQDYVEAYGDIETYGSSQQALLS